MYDKIPEFPIGLGMTRAAVKEERARRKTDVKVNRIRRYLSTHAHALTSFVS